MDFKKIVQAASDEELAESGFKRVGTGIQDTTQKNKFSKFEDVANRIVDTQLNQNPVMVKFLDVINTIRKTTETQTGLLQKILDVEKETQTEIKNNALVNNEPKQIKKEKNEKSNTSIYNMLTSIKKSMDMQVSILSNAFKINPNKLVDQSSKAGNLKDYKEDYSTPLYNEIVGIHRASDLQITILNGIFQVVSGMYEYTLKKDSSQESKEKLESVSGMSTEHNYHYYYHSDHPANTGNNNTDSNSNSKFSWSKLFKNTGIIGLGLAAASPEILEFTKGFFGEIFKTMSGKEILSKITTFMFSNAVVTENLAGLLLGGKKFFVVEAITEAALTGIQNYFAGPDGKIDIMGNKLDIADPIYASTLSVIATALLPLAGKMLAGVLGSEALLALLPEIAAAAAAAYVGYFIYQATEETATRNQTALDPQEKLNAQLEDIARKKGVNGLEEAKKVLADAPIGAKQILKLDNISDEDLLKLLKREYVPPITVSTPRGMTDSNMLIGRYVSEYNKDAGTEAIGASSPIFSREIQKFISARSLSREEPRNMGPVNISPQTQYNGGNQVDNSQTTTIINNYPTQGLDQPQYLPIR